MFRIIAINELLAMLDNYNHKELHVHHTWSPSHKDFNGSNGLQLQGMAIKVLQEPSLNL